MRQRPTALVPAGLVLAGLALPTSSAWAEPMPATETILFIRHGEKSPDGYGQLSCKGLNRALALADRLQSRFGTLDAVFAPDPSKQKMDGGALAYDYVRPLATVEPTAIRFGLPVHAALAMRRRTSCWPPSRSPTSATPRFSSPGNTTRLQALVPQLIKSLGGDPGIVPEWRGGDFDSIWRVTITRRADGQAHAVFAHEHQDLDGQPRAAPNRCCPNRSPRSRFSFHRCWPDRRRTWISGAST